MTPNELKEHAERALASPLTYPDEEQAAAELVLKLLAVAEAAKRFEAAHWKSDPLAQDLEDALAALEAK